MPAVNTGAICKPVCASIRAMKRPQRPPTRSGPEALSKAPMKTPQDVGLREVLFEFHQQGKHLKVNAIDPISGTEVAMIGDPKVGQATLKQLAIRKLVYVMDKKGYGRRPSRGNGRFDELA